MAGTHTFKIATEPWEFEQINRLNYETFVEEIPQHQRNAKGVLVDKFHEENAYIVCVVGGQVVGMLAVRSKRPFSLDGKLADLDAYLPPYRSICEVRLLATQKNRRHSRVAHGLLKETVQYCLDHGHDIAVISGILEQQKLYEHMGFVPFGPVVGTDEALFQPMYLTPENYARSRKPAIQIATIPSTGRVILTPGPVDISPTVRRAFSEVTISHRCAEFAELHAETKELLCTLVGARHVEIFMGSGTLANDVIGGQLSLLQGRGLILANGEFGGRLVDGAKRFGLDFDVLSLKWGDRFERSKIERILDDGPDISWMWAVHCETSTGMLNDIDMLGDICRQRNIRLCLDCISSVGSVPVNVGGAYLASAVSGKGFCSFSGLAMVFYNHTLTPSNKRLPRYLDLQMYADSEGVPFTVSSNLVGALNASLKGLDVAAKYRHNCDISNWLRRELRREGLEVRVEGECAAPCVMTVVVPAEFSSERIGRRLEEWGFFTHYKSGYLKERNWLQICMMGEVSREALGPLLVNLRQLLSRAKRRRRSGCH
ncbi:MAG: aminotransferase class V-fold PLP-dependent enzyme [Phycisphaerae bacterium]|nr:aminotransferase class V-fold PLP-dependent enzyme [Phycisphaerae bacterium]